MTTTIAAINAHRTKCTMRLDDALAEAIAVLSDAYAKDQFPETLSALVWLTDIKEQRGCEHLDTGPRDTGRLVDAISVMVRG